ncbi:hypothetical protein [Rheinheimera sp. MM224]|uniref:hypothetical protein n=1 Tax=Rheinheimera sp. MM224 TaxID=3019969 RepID=UPI0021F8A051|nr:hypothetical protein [Rheinheimera sp. MM224]CAI3805895.1 hypothetical protein JAMGFMIE_03999 [Rheinheimera sp. MM224]
MKISMPMNEDDNEKSPKLESSKLLDLAYETRTIGLLEALNSQVDVRKEKDKLNLALRRIRTENIEEITGLEKTEKVYIFKRIKTIIQINTESKNQEQITIIFASGKPEKISPTSSIETQNDTYINTYQLDTSCIGIAIPKQSTIINVQSINLAEMFKNTLNLRKEIESSNISIHQKKLDLESITRNIEAQTSRSGNLMKDQKNIEKNLKELHQLRIEKEEEIALAEDQKQRVTEERISLEKSLEIIRNEIETEKRNKETAEKTTNLTNNELAHLQDSLEKIKKEILELEQNKRFFDNELSGYTKEGKSQVSIYLIIAAITMATLFFATIFTISNGLDLIQNSTNMDMIDLLLSRAPLTIGISLVISMCFALTYFMINQSIKINSERMKFMQASIIAKDMWTASETVTDLSPFDREKLRQQAKIQLIARIFEENSQSKTDSKIMDALVERVLKKE